MQRAIRYLIVPLLSLAACGEPLPTTTQSPGTQVQPARQSQIKMDVLKGVAARARLARGGRAPAEAMRRIYNRDGQLLKEQVRVGNGWADRPATIPREMLARPVASFLHANGATALMMSPVVTGATATDTVDTLIETRTDSSWIDSTAATHLLVRDSHTEPLSDMVADIYWNSSDSIYQMMAAKTAVIVSVNLLTGDEIVETSYTTSDMITAQYQFASDTAGQGMIRADGPDQAEPWYNRSLRGDIAPRGTGLLALMMEKANCAPLRIAAFGSLLASGLFAAAFLVSVRFLPVWIARKMFNNSVRHMGLAVSSASLWFSCELG